MFAVIAIFLSLISAWCAWGLYDERRYFLASLTCIGLIVGILFGLAADLVTPSLSVMLLSLAALYREPRNRRRRTPGNHPAGSNFRPGSPYPATPRPPWAFPNKRPANLRPDYPLHSPEWVDHVKDRERLAREKEILARLEGNPELLDDEELTAALREHNAASE